MENKLFTRKLGLLREKIAKRYIWSIVLYSAETCTLFKAIQKYLKALKFGAGEEFRSFGLIYGK